MVACTAVNDVFVLTNWAKDSKADGKILMLADGSAEFAKKIGLEIDLTARGLGVRSRRYSMIVEDGVVKSLNVEDAARRATTSPAPPPCARWPERHLTARLQTPWGEGLASRRSVWRARPASRV